MQPTLIGLAVAIVGVIILLTRRVEAMLAFTIACTLMGGSSAVTVTALGASSIAPAQLALGFMILRILLPGNVEHTRLSTALKANIWIGIFTIYAIASAYIFPRLFRHQMDVVPMRPTSVKHMFDAVPLVASSQNITTTAYIVGTFVFAVCTYIAARQPLGPTRIVKTAIVVTWLHFLTGALSLVLPKTVWAMISSPFRNGSYAQLDQTVQGYSRVAGIMPEASTYAQFGLIWFVFMTELWLRDVLPRRTGPAAAAMAAILTISTSSTAYVGLGGYGVLLFIRLAINPRLIPFRKMMWLVAFAFMVTTGVAAMFVFKPALADQLTNLLKHFTLDKANSTSGRQRAFWAKQGLYAFQKTYGLGIGTGSFRSSSIVTAIIGSVGVVGSVAMLLYIWRMLMPTRGSTFGAARDRVDAVGVAASWTAISFFIPAAVSWPSPDPGVTFALFAAVALALRTLPRGYEPVAAPLVALPAVRAIA